MFPSYSHHASRAMPYNEQFVDLEAGLNKITRIDNGTLSEMVRAAMRLPPYCLRLASLR